MIPRSSAGSPAAARLMPNGVPSCALIDLQAIRDNVAALRDHAGGAELMAVVKADGYGHGMIQVAEAAVQAGAGWLGVAHLSEALALRAAGITARVLAWLPVPGDRFAEAVAAGVDIGVSARWALDEVAAASAAQVAGGSGSGGARVQLKVDTGLGRGGVGEREWPDLLDAALRLEAEGLVRLVGVYSHLACADTPSHPSVAAQIAAYTEAVQQAERRGARLELRHLSNSAATVAVPAARFDVVRPGIAVYGLSPVPELAGPAELGLRPAMTLMGRIALVKRVPAGHGVSYGLTYTTKQETTLALLPIGYGDGLPRRAGNCGPALIAGRRVSVVGRVCMDQVVFDLDGADLEGTDAAVTAGDVAILFGPGGDGEPTAQDWAEAVGTIDYEIVTRIGARVPRVYQGRVSG